MKLLSVFHDEAEYYLKRIFKKNVLKKLRNRNDDISYGQFDSNKCIFVHIPKNAGISVIKSLLGKRVGHLTALQYRTVFGKKDFTNYFKFAFVRNPFTRVISAYEFMYNGGFGPEDKELSDIVKKYHSFADFVLLYLNYDTASATRHFRPQHEYICNRSGEILIDFIGRYETINEDYEKIRKIIDIGIGLVKINTTPKSELRSMDFYYNKPEVVKKVAAIYAKDFELFNYPLEIL